MTLDPGVFRTQQQGSIGIGGAYSEPVWTDRMGFEATLGHISMQSPSSAASLTFFCRFRKLASRPRRFENHDNIETRDVNGQRMVSPAVPKTLR